MLLCRQVRRYVELSTVEAREGGGQDASNGEGSEEEFRSVLSGVARRLKRGEGSALQPARAASDGEGAVYELLPALFSEYDPSFWHLTAAEHASAAEHVALMARRRRRLLERARGAT